MPGPQEFMVGSAPRPASFAAPLMDFSNIGNLALDYYAGQKAQHELALQNAFSGPPGSPTGIPMTTDKDGRPVPDAHGIMDRLMQLGGAPYAQQLLHWLLLDDAIKRNPGGAEPGATSDDTGPTAELTPPGPDTFHPGGGTSSANIRGTTSNVAGGPGTNIATIMARRGEIPDGDKAYALAAAIGVPDVTTKLSPDKLRQVSMQLNGRGTTQTAMIGDTTEQDINGGGTSTRSGQGAGGGVSGAPAPIASPASTFDQRFAFAPETPADDFLKPKPVQTQRIAQASPALTVGGPTPGGSSPAPSPPPRAFAPAPGVPRGWDSNAYGQALISSAAKDRAAAQNIAPYNKEYADELKAKAAAKEKRASDIFEYLRNIQEPTPAEKEMMGAGSRNTAEYEALKEGYKKETEQMGKVVSGYGGAANAAVNNMHDIKLARSLVNDPTFASGFGQGGILLVKRMMAAAAQTAIGRSLGLDPNAPVTMEMFKKVMSANVLNQVANLKAIQQEMGGEAGRFFKSQIELMEAAAQNPSNSVAANRALTEIQYRMAQFQIAADNAINGDGGLADQWRAKHGGLLTRGFSTKINDWMLKNDPFSEKDYSDPMRLGAPSVPATLGANAPREAVDAWAKSVGLRPNEPMRLPNGDIVYYPGPKLK